MSKINNNYSKEGEGEGEGEGGRMLVWMSLRLSEEWVVIFVEFHLSFSSYIHSPQGGAYLGTKHKSSSSENRVVIASAIFKKIPSDLGTMHSSQKIDH